jgi:hypothetical protein
MSLTLRGLVSFFFLAKKILAVINPLSPKGGFNDVTFYISARIAWNENSAALDEAHSTVLMHGDFGTRRRRDLGEWKKFWQANAVDGDDPKKLISEN